MSNPYIKEKDLQKILDEYVFTKKNNDNKNFANENSNSTQNGSNSNFASQNTNSFFSNLINGENALFAGIAIGALGAYLFTNENAQKNLFKLVAKGTELFQAGLEEIKERFEDAKAELEEA